MLESSPAVWERNDALELLAIICFDRNSKIRIDHPVQ